MQKTKFRQKISNIYISLGILFCILAVALLIYPQLPHIFNTLSINSPEKEEEKLTQPVYEKQQPPEEIEKEFGVTLPSIDSSLPKTNHIKIPTIGVDAQIQEGENYEEALDDGPWIVPDYGDPESRYLGETSKSIIIASHRFGYSSWTEEKRRKISFFNLPETKVGDRVVIIWNQREYVYEIVEIGESTYVEDYDTDIVLYTCRYFNSPVRIFRYANLVLINGEVPESNQ
jgi:sortase (surface protein transpeptidase)